jgi:hypothetical protein
MTNVVPVPLTRTSDRARAAALVTEALRCNAIEAFRLVEIVDAVSAAVLRAAGLEEAAMRSILAALWLPANSADAGRTAGDR